MEKKKNGTNNVEALGELKVVRELLDAKTKRGGDMYAYVLRYKTMVNGAEREIRVDFVAKDIGGYDMLDMIFLYGDEALLDVREETMVDEDTNEERKYFVYEIWNVDEDAITWSYKVKPARESDKAKLNVILQKRALALDKMQKAAEAAASSEVPVQNKKEG